MSNITNQAMNVLFAFLGALVGGCFTLLGNVIAKSSETSREYGRDLQNIYINCITNLSLVLTLARVEDDSERMDKLETSLAGAKAYLALLLAYEKDLSKEQENYLKHEVNPFVLGQYDNVIKIAQSHGLEPQERFKKYENLRYLPAADVVLQRLIQVSLMDKKLKLPKV